eukprot:scaffold604263_cov22-Prasinocladus_malaysianus.AAC.1
MSALTPSYLSKRHTLYRLYSFYPVCTASNYWAHHRDILAANYATVPTTMPKRAFLMSLSLLNPHCTATSTDALAR